MFSPRASPSAACWSVTHTSMRGRGDDTIAVAAVTT
jgi:hypothetical protein